MATVGGEAGRERGVSSRRAMPRHTTTGRLVLVTVTVARAARVTVGPASGPGWPGGCQWGCGGREKEKERYRCIYLWREISVERGRERPSARARERLVDRHPAGARRAGAGGADQEKAENKIYVF
jgi:hypothetical protein